MAAGADADAPSVDAIAAAIDGLGLVTLFLLAALDNLGLPAAGDAALLAFTAARSHPLVAIGGVALAGAILGDHVIYWLGRVGGERIAHRLLGRDRTATWSGRLERHAPWALVSGRTVAGLRSKVAFLAGAARLPYRRFALWNAVGAGVWVVLMMAAGSLLGRVFDVEGAVASLADYARLAAYAVAGAVVASLLARGPRRRHADRLAAPPLPER